MVRETRYLWVGNLPESIGEDQICDHFSSYGKIQSVKLIQRHEPSEKLSAVVAFMDIKAASKAHDSENIIAGVTVETEYNESSAAVNTSARTQDCSTQRSVPSGAAGQTPGANVQLQQTLHTGRPQQRADGLLEDSGEAKSAEPGEPRDSRKTSDRGPTRGSGVEHDQDRDRSRPRPYPGSHGSHFSSHRSHLDAHGNQGSKLNDSKARTDSSRSESLGHRSSGRGGRSRSRSTGRSQSQGSSESGSQSCEKKLSSVVQLPGAASGAVVKNEDQQSDKPRGLLIHGFPARSTDTSVRDGLFHDYKKYYRGVTVIVEGQGDARYAVVSFKKHEDAAKALEDSKDKRFFGTKVTVTTHPGFEIENSENHSCDTDHNEYSHKATRTLFVGNLDKTTTKDMLRDLFSKYGYIIEIDIKNQGQALSYAFIQFDNIRSVVQALHDMDDKYINTNKVKLGFGKVIPSSCVWVDGVSDTVSEKFLTNQFLKFGVVMSTYIDRRTGRALIFFETSDHASAAISEMRGKCVLEKKIQVDFASRDCQNLFLDHMETTGQLRPGDRPEDRASRGGCAPYGPQEFIRQRPGFEGPPPRGGRFHGFDGHVRGSFNGSRDAFYGAGNRGVGGRGGGCYEGGFPAHDRREGLPLRGGPQKYFDGGHPDEAVFFDSYERELKEYGFSRRDRGDVSPSMERHRSYRGAVGGADSPRSSRYSSPSRERLDDPFAFRYGDAKNKDSDPSYSGESRKDRSGGGAGGGKPHKYQAGYSPANSDFSQISKGRTTKRDSRSTSPVSGKQRFRKERSTSPTSKDYLWNSTSTDELGYQMTSRRGSKESLDCYIFSEKPGKTPVYGKPPHAGSSSKKSRSSRCDDDSDVMSDRDRSLRGIEQPLLLRPKRIIDEPGGARRRSVELPSDVERQRKLELEIARNLGGYPPSAGSARGEFGAEFGAIADSVVKHQLSPKYEERASGVGGSMDLSLVRRFSSSVAVAQVSSGSTTPGSKTPVNNSDQDQDSLGGRNSHGSDDVQTLEKQKQLLLNLLKQMEATSGSDVELPEDEAKKEPIVVDDDSDLEVENDPELSSLRKEYLGKSGDRKNHAGVNDTTATDHGKKDVQVPKSKDTVKLKSIDTSQSFRKQMEAQKDLGTRSSSTSPVQQSAQPDRLMSCRDPLDIVDPYEALNSPIEIPNDFIPTKQRQSGVDGISGACTAKHKRSYRIKLSDDAFSSSGDEEMGAFSPSSSRHSHRSIGRGDDDDDAGIPGGGLPESAPPTSRVISVESSWSGDEMLRELQMPLRRSQRSSGNAEGGGRTEVCIIPDSPVIKGCEGSGPQEPRKTMVGVGRREEAIDLPLPRFAYDTSLPSRSPVLLKPSTPVRVKTPDVVPGDLTADDPPFSPSFTSSPCTEKVDSKPVVDMDISTTEKLPEEKLLKLELCEANGDAGKMDGIVNGDLEVTGSTALPPIVIVPLSVKTESVEASSALQLDSVIEELVRDCVAGANDDTKELDNVIVSEIVVKPCGDDVTTCDDAEPCKTVCKSEIELPTDAVDVSLKPDPEPCVTETAADTTKVTDVDLLLESDESKVAVTSKQNASDSDVSDLLSPTPSLPSIEDRIRALDDMLKLVGQGGAKPVGGTTIEISPAPALDYREKYGRRRREPSLQLPQQIENRNEVSALARTLLSRSSIFDQDSQRLEQLHIKYEPSSEHGRLPNADPYSSMYSPLFRGAVGGGGQDGVPALSSNSSYGYLNSPAVGDIPRSGWGTPGVTPGNMSNWNAGSSISQQLMISTGAVAWPSATATPSPLLASTVSPLSVVSQTSAIAPPPLWPSAGIPNQPGNNSMMLRPTSIESPAAVRAVPFFHQTSFDGARSATSTTPPYSGGGAPPAMYPQSVLVNNADPRRLSRPDLSNVSPLLLSPPIAKRQDSHSSDLDLWTSTSQKHDPAVTPLGGNKPKELVSPPVSILKKQPKEDAPREIPITNDTPPAVVNAVSTILPGVKRKADQAFDSEGSASKSSSLTKIPKVSGPARTDTVVAGSKTDKDFDEKSQRPATTSEGKKHVLTSGSSGKTPPTVDSKKPVAAGSVSPKLMPPGKTEDKKPDVSGGKKLDDSGKSYAKKISKPSGAKVGAVHADKVEHVRKDGQGKVSNEVTGDVSTEPGVGRDKLGKLVKAKVPGKEGAEKEKEKPTQESKDLDGNKLKEKEKAGHIKHKAVEQKNAKPKEGGSEESKKIGEPPVKEEGKKEKAVESGKNIVRKERLMSLDSNKEDAKKLEDAARKQKTTSRENSKEGIKKEKPRHGEKPTVSDSKLSKDKLKPEKPVISKQPKTPPIESSEKLIKKDKTALKINKKERHECKENVADISKLGSEKPRDGKSQNSATGKPDSKQPSSESKSSSSRGDAERGNKSESKKKPSEGSRTTEKKGEVEKKKSSEKKSEKSLKEKRPEEKREIKALLQEAHGADSPASAAAAAAAGYVSMYDMVKRRSKMRGRDDSFGSIEDRSKCLSQLQARSSKRNRSKASLESSILNSDDDDDFKEDSNTTLDSKSDNKSRRKSSTTKRRIDSSSSSSSSSSQSSSEDEKRVTKPSRSKALRTIEDDSSSESDTSMENYFSRKNKPLNDTNTSKSTREPIYSSSSELNDDSEDTRSDGRIAKSKVALGKGPGHKVASESSFGKKGRVVAKKKPVGRHSLSSDDDDDVSNTPSVASLSAGNHVEEVFKSQKKPESATKSRKESTKVEFPAVRKEAKSTTEVESVVENKDKPKKVEKEKSDGAGGKDVKKDSGARDHLTPAKNENRSGGRATKVLTVERKEDGGGITRMDDREDPVKKERHVEGTTSVAKEKGGRERSVNRSDAQNSVMTDPERKAEKELDVDRNKSSKAVTLDKNFQKQTSKAAKVPAGNATIGKNGSVAAIETEKSNRAHIRRESVHEKTKKKPKLDIVKAVVKVEREDVVKMEDVVKIEREENVVKIEREDVVLPASEAGGVVHDAPERMEVESVKDNSVRTDNIFEKMERKADEMAENKPKDLDAENVVVSVREKLSVNIAVLNLETQYSTISETVSETTPMVEVEEEELEEVVHPLPPPPSLCEPPIEIGRSMKERPDLDSAKLTAEKLKEDASKVETIVEAVRTIIDMDRVEETTTDIEQGLDNGLVAVEPGCGDAAEELADSEVIRDDSEEVTQAISILLGKEMGPCEEPERMVAEEVNEEEVVEEEEDDRLIMSQETEDGKVPPPDLEAAPEDVPESVEMPADEIKPGEEEAVPEVVSVKVEESECLPVKVQSCAEIEVKSEVEEVETPCVPEQVEETELQSPAQVTADPQPVFAMPKPLAQKEMPVVVEKEKDVDVRVMETSGLKPTPGKLKLELNGPPGDCADYYAGYFSPYPCAPKEEAEEMNPPLMEAEQVVSNTAVQVVSNTVEQVASNTAEQVVSNMVDQAPSNTVEQVVSNTVEQVVSNTTVTSPISTPVASSLGEIVTLPSTVDAVLPTVVETIKEETVVVKVEAVAPVETPMRMELDLVLSPPNGHQKSDLYEFKDDEKAVSLATFSSSLNSSRGRKRSGDPDSGGDGPTVDQKKPRLEPLVEGHGNIPTSVEAFSKEEPRMYANNATVVPPSSSGMHIEMVQNMISHTVPTSPMTPKPSPANQSPSTAHAPPPPSVATPTTPPTWQSNMDRVIDEVAKGNFQRGHEFDFYVSQKKPRSKSRDEQLQQQQQQHFQQQQQQAQMQQQQSVSHSGGPSYTHSDMSKPHMIMTAPGFLQMSPGAGGPSGGGPRGDAASLHHLQMYNAGVAAARQFVSQPQIVMLSSDKTSPRLTSPLIHNQQTQFRPNTSVYQPGLLTSAMVSSAGTGQQQGLLFCPPPVGYQFSSVAGSHSESGANQLHRFLSPRGDEIARGGHPACSQPHQTNPSPSSRAVEKVSNMPVHSRSGQDATSQQSMMNSQSMNTVLSTANVHNLHEQGSHASANIRLMPVAVSHAALMAHNTSSSVHSASAQHGESQHQQMIQAQAHLQMQHQQQQNHHHHQQQQQQHHQHQQQQQQKALEASTVATSSSAQVQNPDGGAHGRQDYIYRPVGTPQMRFEGVPTLSSLGIVGLDSSMFHPMSPKISEGLLQSLPRQPGTLVAHFGGYPQQVQYGMMLPHGPSLSNNAKDTSNSSSSVPVSSASTPGAASELREALAQPSRLAQQEQLIQQQQNVLHSGGRPPHGLPDLCPSPVGLGQHRMPFTIQEPRSMSTSRAEPKATGGPPSSVESSAGTPLPTGPPISLIQPFGDPASSACHSSAADKVPLGMVEMRTPGGQQMYRSDPRIQMLKYDQGVAAAHGLSIDSRQLEQLMLSTRVMSPQIAQHHHMMVAGQMQSQQQQQQQQQPAMSPFSHPDHPIGGGRPPSVHHLPTVGSASVPQGHVARPSPDNSDTIGNLLQRFPVMWNGTLELKNDRAPVQMHFISGNRTLVPASLQENNKPLHIGQRMRLEAAQLEQVSRRMMNESEYSMLVAVPSGTDALTLMTAAHSLQNGFIRYLQEKQAAGIVNIYQPSTNQATYVIHIFPPCEFSSTNLARFAQDVVQHTADSNYLLIVITTC